MRPTWAEINLAAIAHNVKLLAQLAQPAKLCAVVKANGYGHGIIPVARTAIHAGADMLAVALVEEGAQLREAGLQTPILMLSEPTPNQFGEVVELGLTPTIYQLEGLAAANAAAAKAKVSLPVHLKIDTGMARVGASAKDAVSLANAIVAHETLDLAGVWTHCAMADSPDHPFTAQQIQRFNQIIAELTAAGHNNFCAHLANSAACMANPESRLNMVRCGISVYGIAPSRALEGCVALKSAMTIRTKVSMVKQIPAGTAVSYGHHYTATHDTQLASIPIGYADGLPRCLGLTGGEVLIGGQRRPIAGVVTMDQTMVDCGTEHLVAVGDEVVLLGKQGNHEITATEIADHVDTIAYEIITRLGPRLPLHFTKHPYTTATSDLN
ncbi:MAG: alanine racemase [Acidimicrobiia bacterium]|nr:alanine racemase [Acidimicrobiia bacterium]